MSEATDAMDASARRYYSDLTLVLTRHLGQAADPGVEAAGMTMALLNCVADAAGVAVSFTEDAGSPSEESIDLLMRRLRDVLSEWVEEVESC